ncbi:Reverse transcriptase (RNA-dependent DNA polymerase), partial [Popillia japonica]
MPVTDAEILEAQADFFAIAAFPRVIGAIDAAEIFQDTVRQVLVGIAGVINVSDDILVFGKSQEEHDVALESVLERLKQSGLTLNERKCAFMKTSIHFLGFIFSDKGIAPDPKKVEAINNLDPPKNPSEVRSLLGMFNYVGKFIPNLASKTQPFRNLITKDCKWNWTTKHQNIFDGLKKQLSEAPNLVYYDATKVIHLYVDAGPQGLGAILIQEKNGVTETVAYGSRSLTATEGRYSQIEKEMLA